MSSMGNYKITSGFTFNLDGLFPKYALEDLFPIRPKKLDGLGEILSQISDQRKLLADFTPLVIFETSTHQYRIENRKRSYDDDVYFTIHKIHSNDLRTIICSMTHPIDRIEEMIIQHIASNLEWERV